MAAGWDAVGSRRWRSADSSRCREPQGWTTKSRSLAVLSPIGDGTKMLEDREQGRWFMLVDSSPPESAIVRHDSSGKIARLEIPGLRGSLAEGPEGTVWAMTSQELIQLKHSEQRLDIVVRYALPDKVRDGVWCDPFGGVWFTRNFASSKLNLLSAGADSRQHQLHPRSLIGTEEGGKRATLKSGS